MVASSWIDIEAGLSKKYIFRTPPGFCANAPPPAITPPSNIPVSASARASKFIGVHPHVLWASAAKPAGYMVERGSANDASGCARINYRGDAGGLCLAAEHALDRRDQLGWPDRLHQKIVAAEILIDELEGVAGDDQHLGATRFGSLGQFHSRSVGETPIRQ